MENGKGWPEWAWFPPEAEWWAPARVWWDLSTDRISARQVLPRLVGSGHAARFTDEWVDRFDPPEMALVDDDPHVKTVPGPMSHRWLALLADHTDGDRAATLRRLADPSADVSVRERESLRLRELYLFVTLTTMDEAWTEGGWLARGSFWFLNSGLITPSTLLDLIELEAEHRTYLLPEATPVGVVGEVDSETYGTYVIAAYEPDTERGDATRAMAHRRLHAWLAGGPPEPMDVQNCNYINKTYSHGHIRGNLTWPTQE